MCKREFNMFRLDLSFLLPFVGWSDSDSTTFPSSLSSKIQLSNTINHNFFSRKKRQKRQHWQSRPAFAPIIATSLAPPPTRAAAPSRLVDLPNDWLPSHEEENEQRGEHCRCGANDYDGQTAQMQSADYRSGNGRSFGRQSSDQERAERLQDTGGAQSNWRTNYFD